MQFIKVVFPAPVRPTIPTVVPASIDKLILINALGKLFLYLAE